MIEEARIPHLPKAGINGCNIRGGGLGFKPSSHIHRLHR